MLELEDEVQRLLQENNKLRKTVNNSQNFEQLYSSKQKEFEELRDQKKKLLSEMTNQKSDREKSGFQLETLKRELQQIEDELSNNIQEKVNLGALITKMEKQMLELETSKHQSDFDLERAKKRLLESEDSNIQLSRQLEQLASEKQIEKDKSCRLTSELKQKSEEVEILRKKIAQKEGDEHSNIRGLKQSNKDLSTKVRTLEDDRFELEKRLKEYERQFSRISKLIESSKDQKESHKIDPETRQTINSTEFKGSENEKSFVGKLDPKFTVKLYGDVSDLITKVEIYESENRTLQSQIKKLRSQRDSIEDQLLKQVDQLEQENDLKSEEIRHLQSKIGKIEQIELEAQSLSKYDVGKPNFFNGRYSSRQTNQTQSKYASEDDVELIYSREPIVTKHEIVIQTELLSQRKVPPLSKLMSPRFKERQLLNSVASPVKENTARFAMIERLKAEKRDLEETLEKSRKMVEKLSKKLKMANLEIKEIHEENHSLTNSVISYRQNIDYLANYIPLKEMVGTDTGLQTQGQRVSFQTPPKISTDMAS